MLLYDELYMCVSISLTVDYQRMTDGACVVSPLLIEGCLENHSYLSSSFLYGYHDNKQCCVLIFVIYVIQKRRQYLLIKWWILCVYNRTLTISSSSSSLYLANWLYSDTIDRSLSIPIPIRLKLWCGWQAIISTTTTTAYAKCVSSFLSCWWMDVCLSCSI